MDVHKEAISIAVRNGSGKPVMESIIETEAATILQFIQSLRGELHVTFEEGTWAAWLYDLLKRQVHELVVCDPRRNALLKEGSKNDKVDARKLSDLLRAGLLRSVYHGENGLRTLRELARSYSTLSKDMTRVMNRLKALYRGWGIPSMIRVIASSGWRRSGKPACAVERSFSMAIWMDCMPCGNKRDASC
jgi:Transposase